MATTRHTTKMMASLTRPFPEVGIFFGFMTTAEAPGQVLRRAKRGTSKDLSLLCARLDEDTLSVEVFRFLLQHFDRTHIPTVRRDGISDAQLKGLMVSFTLPDVVKIVKSDQAVKGRLLDGIVDEILKVFEDIIAWLNHNIDYGLSIPMDKDPQDFLTAYVGNANVLYSLLDLSPRVLDALYSSPCATDLVIKLWVTKNWGKIHTRMTVFNERCPIHVLLLHCIDTIDGKRLFSDKVRVYQCEGLPERFLGGVAQRIAVWKGLLEAKTILPEGAAMHYLDMCDVVLHLMADPVFQRAAVSIGIWSVMIPPIEVMARVGRAELILACLNHVISAAVLISATRTRNCYDLLQNGDLIAIFIRVIEKSLNPDSLMLALCILKMLVTMCHFPEVPDWLSDLLNGRFRALTKKLEDHPQEELRNAWRLLVARMNVGILALDATRGELRPAPRSAEGRPSRGLTTIGFCDNPLVSVCLVRRSHSSLISFLVPFTHGTQSQTLAQMQGLLFLCLLFCIMSENRLGCPTSQRMPTFAHGVL